MTVKTTALHHRLYCERGLTMKNLKICPMWLALVVLTTANIALAGSAAIGTMADITMHLHHFPTDADKSKLAAIIDDKSSSQEEVTIATALANLQHKVLEADAAKLQAIVVDSSASADARELAGILLNIAHMPSEADIAKLKVLAEDSD